MANPSLVRQIFWGTTWLNVSNGISMATGFVLQIVLVRCMGLVQYGSMQIAVAAFELVVVLFDLNLYYSAIRYGADALARNDRERYEQVFSVALQIKVALCCLLLGLSGVAAWLGASYRGEDLGVPFLLLSTNYLMSSLLGYATTLYNTEKRFGVVAFQNAAAAVTMGVAMTTAAALRGTMVAVLTGQLIASFLIASVALYFVRRRIYLRRFSREVLKEVSVYAGQFAVSSIMKRILGKTDMLIVGYFLSAREAGLYRIAQSFASPVYNATGPLWSVLFPIVSELAGKRDYPRIMTLFLRGNRLLTVSVLPLAALASPLVPLFLRLAYNVESSEAVTTCILLFWASILTATVPMLPPILRVFRNDVATWYSIGTTSLNVLLDLTLVPRLGIVGCGVAMLATVALSGIYIVVYTYRFLSARTPPTGGLGHLYFVPVAAGLIASALLGLKVVTVAGALVLVGVALWLRMLSVGEIRRLLQEIRPR